MFPAASSPPPDRDHFKSGIGFEGLMANALMATALIAIPAVAICALLGLL